ncbi:MAG TPA: helix-turn-helix transcriptional regulator [Thermomicrobiales bacterium]|nr:helix-turn-helix transcriptional regulator [Thermomicrobiales bacterium]
MNLKQNLGKVVRRRRLELGLTQTELAERMRGNVQQADISHIEHGHLPWPRPDLIQALAVALSMSPVELILLSGWMSADEYQRYRTLCAPEAEKPLAILGPGDSDDALACWIDSMLTGYFRTLTAFDGGTLLESIVSQSPELVIVSQDCPRMQFDLMEAALQRNRLPTKVIVIGNRRGMVPRDLRFHYLEAPATQAALESLLGAMGYRWIPAA